MRALIIIICTLCLLIMCALAAFVIAQFYNKDRRDRWAYIKSFKRGKFAAIYFVAVPIYFLAFMNDGSSVWGSILLGFKSSIDLVVLKFDYNSVNALINANTLFAITANLCFVMVLINAFLFGLSVFGQLLINGVRKTQFRHSTTATLVVGYNKHNDMILDSTKGKVNIAVLAKLAADDKDDLFVKGVPYFDMKDGANIAEFLTKKFGKAILPDCVPLPDDGDMEKWYAAEQKQNYGKRLLNIIVNYEKITNEKTKEERICCDDDKNVICVQQISNYIIDNNLNKCVNNGKYGIKAFVFGEPENENSYLYFTEKTSGLVQYINKYRLGAIDFIDKYPMTQFMDARYIDYDSACLKDDAEINFIFIGFGKSNQQLFLSSVANNQFIEKDGSDGKVKIKQVHYSIFDKKNAENDKNLNHSYWRIKNECKWFLRDDTDAAKKERDEKYLPMPDEPAILDELGEDGKKCVDINDVEFYNKIKGVIDGSTGKNTYSYIAISFGADLENIDLAEKLTAKIAEWNVEDAVKIFAKVRNPKLAVKVGEEKRPYLQYGNEAEVAYNIDVILREKMSAMAMQRDIAYNLCKEGRSVESLSADELAVRKLLYTKKMNEKTQYERLSNLYAILSLRFKLQLLGLDYKPSDAVDKGISIGEYLSKYAEGDTPDYIMAAGKTTYDDTVAPIDVNYDVLNYNKESTRYKLAQQEHYRWNSYMLCSGIIPASRAEILNEKKANGDYTNGKNYALRRHGNITTFDGLVEFREMIEKRDDKPAGKEDVIRYDFQILDHAYWVLREMGYTIVQKQ